MNGYAQDINGNATILGAAISTVAVWGASLFGVTVPGEVATAFTTIVAVSFGLIRGKNGTNRRSGDKKA